MQLRGCALVLAVVCACGGGPRSAAPGGDASAWRIIEFSGATLAARRPGGAPWHQAGADHTGAILGGLLGLAVGNPAVGLALGSVIDGSGGDPIAPAPYVMLKIGRSVYAISPVGRTYSPVWPQPIAIDTRPLSPDEPALIQVMDAVDGALLGQQQLTVGELLARPVRTLTDLGPVASLDVRVSAAPPRGHAAYDFAVPSEATVRALRAGQFPAWTAVPVWNGDLVTIEASGTVCPSRMSSDCFGPEGAEPGRWTSYSYDGFKDSPHASLVGEAPGARFAVGRRAQLRVPQSGYLLLFVNDEDTGNNHGGFQVHVTVDPP
ncbi:MAG TPA: hypothetical protein VFP84_15890 [Kofleriaceae bacterium]|nr:hypothetical protein [Kofleriaceae bacterium]